MVMRAGEAVLSNRWTARFFPASPRIIQQGFSTPRWISSAIRASAANSPTKSADGATKTTVCFEGLECVIGFPSLVEQHSGIDSDFSAAEMWRCLIAFDHAVSQGPRQEVDFGKVEDAYEPAGERYDTFD